MTTLPVILLLPGSLRHGSVNDAVLRTVPHLTPGGVRTFLYERLASLPHFNPDDDTDPPPEPVAELRAAIGEADAVLICTPEYAGTLPGSFKNLLDWTIGGTETSDKPMAWINAAAEGRGHGAEATLRTVLGYAGADIVESACARVPVRREAISADGIITDPTAREELRAVIGHLAESAGFASTPHEDR